jgi:hypothetical protein
MILAAGHGSASHESSGTVGADISGSWLNPDGGSVDARLKPAPCEFRDSCRGGDGVLKHELLFASHGSLFAISSPSLLLLTTGRLDGGGGQPAEVLPTHRRHSRASPKARSQRPISRGGSPESLAQALLE